MVVSVLLLVVPTALAIVAMLVVRHFAPPGGFLSGMESADGIFSAAGAGLAVLLAFVIFTVFDSYANARTAAGQEAVAAQQMYSTAGFFPDTADQLRGLSGVGSGGVLQPLGRPRRVAGQGASRWSTA